MSQSSRQRSICTLNSKQPNVLVRSGEPKCKGNKVVNRFIVLVLVLSFPHMVSFVVLLRKHSLFGHSEVSWLTGVYYSRGHSAWWTWEANFVLRSWDRDAINLELVLPWALPQNHSIAVWSGHPDVFLERPFRTCGLLGLWNLSACQCSASFNVLCCIMEHCESQGRHFGKHLFDSEISILPVNLPGPRPHLMK